MKITPLRFALGLVVALGSTGISATDPDTKDKKKDEIFLEDLLFDAKYLKQFLGPKTLLLSGTGKPVPPEAMKAISAAGLNEKSQFFPEPAGVDAPQLVASVPHNYPQSKLLGGDIKAAYLAFVGTDGSVKCVWCYSNTDRIFAIAGGMAISRWRYEPVKIKGKAVPALLEITYDPNHGDVAVGVFKGPRSANSVPGNPRELRPARPEPPGGNPPPSK